MTSHTSSSARVLAGDVGGTKTLLGLFEPATRRPVPVEVRRYATSASASIDAVIAEFLRDAKPKEQVSCVVLGVAGPIVNGRAQLTNHPWAIDAAEVGRVVGAPVYLVNDLEALAYSLDVLDEHEVLTLLAGQPDPVGPMAVLAAGTGLGQALLVRANGRPVACPSEGGHADFAPRHPREDELVRLLRRLYGRATVERVLSGPGLLDLHRLTHEGGSCPAVEGVDHADRPGAISASALGRRCARCEEALALFVSAYGSEAGNLALRALATGGLYVGGGIAAHIEPALRTPTFAEAFLDKPPMRALLERIPVRVILAPEAGLLGAAVVAQRHLR